MSARIVLFRHLARVWTCNGSYRIPATLRARRYSQTQCQPKRIVVLVARVTFAIERIIESAALRLGFDPFDLQRRVGQTCRNTYLNADSRCGGEYKINGSCPKTVGMAISPANQHLPKGCCEGVD